MSDNGCWVVWVEGADPELVSVHDDELDAYRTAFGGGGAMGVHLTFVPFGKSVYDVLPETP